MGERSRTPVGPLLRAVALAVVAVLVSPVALAQGVPVRQIPPSVLAELQDLDNRFDSALAADCDSRRCFSKGCTYVDHAVADQPRAMSLPGLGSDPGPGSVAAQEYLTRARCTFAYEESVDEQDAQALARRLQSKVSKAWTSVSVSSSKLQALPAYLGEPPPPPVLDEQTEAVATPARETFSAGVAGRELWDSLLPHYYWMIGLVMMTLAGTILVWAWRRVGRESLEEQALLAQMAGTESEIDDDDAAELALANPEEPEDERAFGLRQREAWGERLAAVDPDDPELELQALIRDLLRSEQWPLLAKAVLTFPVTFLATFPAGGDIASAKLELADFLKTVDVDALPSDADFFRNLNRHALSAALVTQSDAQIVRSLREEFGTAGLVSLIDALVARPGALLFALAPADEQHELVRLLSSDQKADLAEQLLRSNRMNPSETAYLFEVLRAARGDHTLPPAPTMDEVSDRGSAFDAAGALSVLLPGVESERRTALFAGALQRFHGSLPAWYREILVPDMLFALSGDARNDLMLGLDVQTLAAWMSLLDPSTTDWLQSGMPGSLRVSVQASMVFASRSQQLALAERGRRELARGLQAQLAREGLAFEQIVQSPAVALLESVDGL